MDKLLREHLLAVFAAFQTASGLSDSWAARKIAGDSRFFSRLAAADATVTARKYDEVMAAFAAGWPAGADWPAEVPRPAAAPAAGAQPLSSRPATAGPTDGASAPSFPSGER